MAEATWAEISATLKDEAGQRKTIQVSLGGMDAEFVIRQLTQREEDQAQAKMSMKFSKQAGGGEIPMELSEVKIAKFRAGVVSGPSGFSPQNPAHIAQLPASVREEIVACIDDFSALDEVTRLSFRGRGASGESDTDNGGRSV